MKDWFFSVHCNHFEIVLWGNILQAFDKGKVQTCSAVHKREVIFICFLHEKRRTQVHWVNPAIKTHTTCRGWIQSAIWNASPTAHENAALLRTIHLQYNIQSWWLVDLNSYKNQLTGPFCYSSCREPVGTPGPLPPDTNTGANPPAVLFRTQ